MINHSNSDYLPPVQENDFLPPLGRWTTVGGMVFLGIMWVAIALASVAQYKVTVKAQAAVRPTGELRIVQAATEGAIMRVLVKGNQVVKKGDVIATIESSRFETKKSQLQTNIQQSQLQLIQINSQISALDRQIKAETERINRTIDGAEAEYRGRSRTYQDKLVTTATEASEASANVSIAQKDLQKAFAELKAAQANLSATKAALGAAKSKRNRYETVAKQGALSQDQFEEAQLAVDQQSSAVEGHQATVEAQKQTIERLKQEILAATARQQRAQAVVNPSNAEVAIAFERIAQERATGEAFVATLNKERDALVVQKITTQKQLERDTRELKQIEFDLSQTTITATADGIISKLNLRNPGQSVRAGEEIAQIVPTNAPLTIKAAVLSQEKSKLKEGQKVQMRVSACPFPDYGTLKGRVKTISPDAIVPQANNANATDSTTTTTKAAGSAFYEVMISPESLSFGQPGRPQCFIQAGMEGTVDIISREETVLQFFLRKARLIADF